MRNENRIDTLSHLFESICLSLKDGFHRRIRNEIQDVAIKLKEYNTLKVPEYFKIKELLSIETSKRVTVKTKNSKEDKFFQILDLFRQLKLTQKNLFKKGN
jgi:hypothetical protein